MFYVYQSGNDGSWCKNLTEITYFICEQFGWQEKFLSVYELVEQFMTNCKIGKTITLSNNLSLHCQRVG